MSWDAPKVRLYPYFKQVPPEQTLCVAIGAMAKGQDDFADSYVDEKIGTYGNRLTDQSSKVGLTHVMHCRRLRLRSLSFSGLRKSVLCPRRSMGDYVNICKFALRGSAWCKYLQQMLQPFKIYCLFLFIQKKKFLLFSMGSDRSGDGADRGGNAGFKIMHRRSVSASSCSK